MNCVVTAGPTYEPLDQVRRLTNFSSGKLGSLLADHLAERGHQVTLLLGHYAIFRTVQKVQEVETFSTTENLREKLQALSSKKVDAIFHAAAVSDFRFGKILEQQADGSLQELKAGKISTRGGSCYAELVPTPKIIRELRGWFKQACIVGWKYEVDGDRAAVVTKSRQQMIDGKTDACVANGPAYGFGFGLVTMEKERHFSDTNELFVALETLANGKAAR